MSIERKPDQQWPDRVGNDPLLSNRSLATTRVPGWIGGIVRVFILLVLVLLFVASLLPLAVERLAQDGHPLWLVLWLAGFIGTFVVWFRGWVHARDPDRPRSVRWIVVAAALMAAVMIGLVLNIARQGGLAALIQEGAVLGAGFGILGIMLSAIALLRGVGR